MKFKYDQEQLQELKALTDTIRLMEGLKVEPLTPELLTALVKRFENGIIHWPNSNPDQLFEQPFSGACGCLGPHDGEPFCGCTMQQLQYQYRYDIALALVD